VTRDDLPDGGSTHFAATVEELRTQIHEIAVEVLPPDFQGQEAAIATVIRTRPNVFNHNLETCERLTPLVRSRADYRRSLSVLATAARLATPGATLIKSGIMLGMGETRDEIHAMMRHLRESGVEIITVGQYLPPTPRHWPVSRHIAPAEFDEWAEVARGTYGFRFAVCGPLVRSSYRAQDAAAAAGASRNGDRITVARDRTATTCLSPCDRVLHP